MTRPTPFLDIFELRRIAHDVRLKHGWHLEVYEDAHLGSTARFVGNEPNSYRPGELVDLGIDSPIPPCRDERAFLDWIAWRWREIWVHEARETLWYLGELVSDPHAV